MVSQVLLYHKSSNQHLPSDERLSPTTVSWESIETRENEKQVIIIQALDLLTHYQKPNQPCVAGLDRPKVLYYVVLLERQDPSETSEVLTNILLIWETN